MGQDVYIARGVTIRTGAIIEDGSHVVSDVPEYAIIAGNPGRIVGYRFELPTAARLVQSRWWDFDVHNLLGSPILNANEFLQEVERNPRPLPTIGFEVASDLFGNR